MCWPLGEGGQRQGTYVAVSAGSDHTCALRASGALDCWGGSPWGRLLRWDPEKLAGPYRAVSAGRSMTCALRESGEAVCWFRAVSLGDDPFPNVALTTGGP